MTDARHRAPDEAEGARAGRVPPAVVVLLRLQVLEARLEVWGGEVEASARLPTGHSCLGLTDAAEGRRGWAREGDVREAGTGLVVPGEHGFVEGAEVVRAFGDELEHHDRVIVHPTPLS